MKVKVLHLGFHSGCAKDVEYACLQCGFDFTHRKFTDGVTEGNKIYNVSKEIANNAWESFEDYYNSFDLIITSDTAPISRVLIQNNFKKPLVVWICNRFDYFDNQTYDGSFPDKAYYDLFKEERENTVKVAYTAFEKIYAKLKRSDEDIKGLIQPFGAKTLGIEHDDESRGSGIPLDINKSEVFFIPPYRNDTEILNVARILNDLGIANCASRYGSPLELKDFKGVIHVPYAWSNLALFENLNIGVVYFLPSLDFWKKLDEENKPHGLFFSNPKLLNMLKYSEWYSEYNKDNFFFFDSWAHLKHLTTTITKEELEVKREAIIKRSKKRNENNLNKWKNIFRNFNLLEEE